MPNIIDRNLNKDYQILIIFGRNISDTTGYSHLTQRPLLLYVGKTDQA